MTGNGYARTDAEVLDRLKRWERVLKEARSFARAGPLEPLDKHDHPGRVAAREDRRQYALGQLREIRSCLEEGKRQAKIWRSEDLAQQPGNFRVDDDASALPQAVEALEKAIETLQRLRGSNALEFMDGATPDEWRAADWFWVFYDECRGSKRGSIYYATLKKLASIFGRSLWAEPYMKLLRLARAKHFDISYQERLSKAIEFYRNCDLRLLCGSFLDEVRRSRKDPADLKRCLATGTSPTGQIRRGSSGTLSNLLRETLTPRQLKKFMKSWFESPSHIRKLRPGRMAAQIAHLKFGVKIADLERAASDGLHTVE